MLTEKEIIDRIEHYKTIGIQVNILPYFEIDVLQRKYKSINSEDIKYNHLTGLYDRLKNQRLDLDNEDNNTRIEQIKNQFTDSDQIRFYIFKNTNLEELSDKCEIIDSILENINDKFVESDIFTLLAKKFKIKASSSSRNTEEEREEIPRNSLTVKSSTSPRPGGVSFSLSKDPLFYIGEESVPMPENSVTQEEINSLMQRQRHDEILTRATPISYSDYGNATYEEVDKLVKQVFKKKPG